MSRKIDEEWGVLAFFFIFSCFIPPSPFPILFFLFAFSSLLIFNFVRDISFSLSTLDFSAFSSPFYLTFFILPNFISSLFEVIIPSDDLICLRLNIEAVLLFWFLGPGSIFLVILFSLLHIYWRWFNVAVNRWRHSSSSSSLLSRCRLFLFSFFGYGFLDFWTPFYLYLFFRLPTHSTQIYRHLSTTFLNAILSSSLASNISRTGYLILRPKRLASHFYPIMYSLWVRLLINCYSLVAHQCVIVISSVLLRSTLSMVFNCPTFIHVSQVHSIFDVSSLTCLELTL